MERSPAHRRRQSAHDAQRSPDPLMELVLRRRFRGHLEFDRLSHAYGGPRRASTAEGLVDFLLLTEGDPHSPSETFDRLRWGGQVVLVSRRKGEVQAVAQQYRAWRMEESDHSAWCVEHPLGIERKGLLRLPLPGFRSPAYFMTARKVMLVPPGKYSDRFTYHVRLEKNAHNGRYEVVKEVPTLERVLARLREKFPDADEDLLRRRAKKFTEKIFPVFLTRETAMLKLLARDLPRKFRDRVPHVIDAATDSAGFTRTLRMNWLRNALPCQRGADRGKLTHRGAPLSQLEFARQATELLAALHDDAGIIHLDLRLDNVVITEHGVGFVDFGSAVRVNEEFAETSLLSSLFDEMMRTSQIQRMLGKMTELGQVTSEEITSSHQRFDKAVDFFYLALQINNPLSNPDFPGLVEYLPESDQARELKALTTRILRPEDPQAAQFTSARDILKGIRDIADRLAR